MTVSSPPQGAFASFRRPVLQAVGLIVALVPLALLASYELAQATGALAPQRAALVTGMVLAVGATLALGGLMRGASYPHARLGLCNAVTLLRGAGIAVLAGLVVTPVAALGWALVALAGAILALDAVDGWAARRAGLQSSYGARLDMETDVAFALVLAALAVALGQVGVWFLALGLLRPVFILAGRVWPALRAPLPPAPWRRRMAALQMTAQVVLITPALSVAQGHALGASLLAAIIVSFAIDIRALLAGARA